VDGIPGPEPVEGQTSMRPDPPPAADQAVVLHPYDPAWPARFESEATLLTRALAPWITGGVHHVGSTAVPGLAAKPIIDIMVGVRTLEDGRAAFPTLAALGYLYSPYNGDIMHWFCKPSIEVRTHHLYLMEKDHREWRAHIAFRDYLRAHPETAEAYEKLKRELAERFRDDREAYTRAKGEFVAEVVTIELGSSERGERTDPREMGGPPSIAR
jgi:GrpB-like predicted nucleotidyltransferase (UPF0157 family)